MVRKKYLQPNPTGPHTALTEVMLKKLKANKI